MRVLKWAGIGVGGLVVVALLALLLAPYLVNLERYRSLLASRASRALGRDVALGSLHVSLWRGIGAEAEGIRIAAAPGFGAEPFITADALRVRLQFLPLLKGQVKVGTATLERPRIRVTRTAEGRWSFEDLLKPAPTAAPTRPAPETPRPAKPPLLGGVLLSEVDVKDGAVTLLDQAGKTPITVTLTELDLRLRQTALSDPIQVRSRAQLAGDGGRLEVAGRVLPEGDASTLDLTLTLKEVASSLLQALLLGPDSSVQLAGRLSGEAKVSGPAATAAVSGELDLTRLGVRIGSLSKPPGEEGRLAFAAQREEPGVRLSRLGLRLKDLSVDGKLQIPDLKNPKVVFEASAQQLDLDRLLAGGKARAEWLGAREAAAAPAAPGPPSVPVQGRVRVADLRYGGLAWSGLDGEVRYQGGVLTIPALEAGFMQGRIAVSGEVDFRAKQPRAALKTRLADVATEPLMKALAKPAWSLQSRLTGATDLRFTGLAGPAILGSAAGGGSLQLKDGRLVDYKPLDRLSEVLAPILAAQGLRTIRLDEFQQLAGTFSLDKGVLRTKDLTLTKAEGTVAAVGSLGLLDSTLDFDVTARLGRTTLEAKVTGTTNQPTVVPKFARLQEKLERELEKALPGEQGKGLKDLFRGFFSK